MACVAGSGEFCHICFIYTAAAAAINGHCVHIIMLMAIVCRYCLGVTMSSVAITSLSVLFIYSSLFCNVKFKNKNAFTRYSVIMSCPINSSIKNSSHKLQLKRIRTGNRPAINSSISYYDYSSVLESPQV